MPTTTRILIRMPTIIQRLMGWSLRGGGCANVSGNRDRSGVPTALGRVAAGAVSLVAAGLVPGVLEREPVRRRADRLGLADRNAEPGDRAPLGHAERRDQLGDLPQHVARADRAGAAA